MTPKAEEVTLEEVDIQQETEEAYRIEYDEMECWIPKSQVSNLEEVNAAVTNEGVPVIVEELVIPTWLAGAKDLI